MPRLGCVGWIVEGDECSDEGSAHIAGDRNAALPAKGAQPSCDEGKLSRIAESGIGGNLPTT